MNSIFLKKVLSQLEREEELILQHVIIPEDEQLCMKVCEMRKQAEEAEEKTLAEETNIPYISPIILMDTQLACGSYHTAVITEDRSLWTFGSEGVRKVFFSDRVVSVSCGRFHTAVITEDRRLWTFGIGHFGQLGNDYLNRMKPQPLPHKVEKLNKMISVVACGGVHTAAIAVENQQMDLWTFGDARNGQLGHGEDENRYVPCKVERFADNKVVSVACGTFHTAAIVANGSLWTFGSGEYGQLGHGGTDNELLPRKVEALDTVVFVACGAHHTAVIIEDGSLWTFGKGEFGQLGHGRADNELLPRRVEAFISSKVVSVACGSNHTAAITEDQQLWTFGRGNNGQLSLGSGHTDNELLPRKVEAFHNGGVVSVACGRFHTAVIVEHENQRSLWTFGLSSNGCDQNEQPEKSMNL